MTTAQRSEEKLARSSIDFVVLWVDGADPKWLEKRNKYDNGTDVATQRARYRDWGLFKYWFRGVAKYAPWVHHIYLVTDEQKPEWLNNNHPKLTVIDHKDIIDSRYLPTFNSQAIEMNLHKIPGLAEHFVYFNDDTFIINMVKPSDFFKNGLPVEIANINAATGMEGDQLYAQTMFNDVLLINRHFKKNEIVNRHPLKWLNPKYGAYNLRTLSQMPYPFFTGYKPQHLSTSFLKRTYDEVWKVEKEALENTCSHKFRHREDLNQDVFVMWQLCRGCFVPRANRFGDHIMLKDKISAKKVAKLIVSSRKKMICINDGVDLDVSAEVINSMKNIVLEAFNEKFSGQSKYEK